MLFRSQGGLARATFLGGEGDIDCVAHKKLGIENLMNCIAVLFHHIPPGLITVSGSEAPHLESALSSVGAFECLNGHTNKHIFE